MNVSRTVVMNSSMSWAEMKVEGLTRASHSIWAWAPQDSDHSEELPSYGGSSRLHDRTVCPPVKREDGVLELVAIEVRSRSRDRMKKIWQELWPQSWHLPQEIGSAGVEY